MKRTALAVALLAMSAGSVFGETTIATEAGSGIRITHDGPLLIAPSGVYLRITIENASRADRMWRFEFTSMHYGGQAVQRVSRFELAVEQSATRSFELHVPVHDGGAISGGWVSMRIFGYGLSRPGQPESIAGLTGMPTAVSTTLAASDQSLPDYFGQAALVMSKDFPADWRGYVGFASIWLKSAEWESLDPAARRALSEWVARGGRLILVQDATRGAAEEPYGLGAILSVSPETLRSGATAEALASTPAGFSPKTWAERVVEPLELREGLLSLALFAYFLLIGPVNLFVFAPPAQRLRLFWTMPSIALGASGALAGLIVLQDGVGGAGARSAFVYLMPELKREIVVQDQASRTGALLSRGFELDEDVLMLDRSSELRPSTSLQRSAGSQYAGDWFVSRAIQVHSLDRSRPSRARVELIATESAPAILSSIEGELSELYYWDMAGQSWRAENVVPGRPAQLTRVSSSGFAQWQRRVGEELGPRVSSHLGIVSGRRGAFVAAARAGASDVPIDTLPSIVWTDSVLYAGPVLGSE